MHCCQQEEQQLLELHRYQQFRQSTVIEDNFTHLQFHLTTAINSGEQSKPAWKCYACGSTAHLLRTVNRRKERALQLEKTEKVKARRVL